MARGSTSNADGAGSTHLAGPSDAALTAVMELFKGLMEGQQEQTMLLRDRVLTAQQTAIAALQKVKEQPELRPGNVSDFCKLQPTVFTGTEKPLEEENWLVDMKLALFIDSLLRACLPQRQKDVVNGKVSQQ